MLDYIKNNAVSINAFGLGFIQIKLGNDTSINVYMNDIFKFSDSDSPHSHQRDFHSKILSGELIEYLYDVSIVKDGISAYCGCGDTEKDVNHRYKYRLKEMYAYKQGDSYFRGKDEFHSVSAQHSTVTMITKDMKSSHDAIVISNETVKLKNHSYDDSTLWNMVEPILSNINMVHNI